MSFSFLCVRLDLRALKQTARRFPAGRLVEPVCSQMPARQPPLVLVVVVVTVVFEKVMTDNLAYKARKVMKVGWESANIIPFLRRARELPDRWIKRKGMSGGTI
jgi:hypothetical protein